MNRLSKEISPYLLQHAENPVNWYPWGAEALAEARRQNKPIFLSIGYATCHWCHVMEGDSFEKEDVAAVLNQNFISIKVDREERPEIDSLYMKAVQAMNQRGGWPLSLALTPEGKPFWGGTFFQREQFKQILSRLAEIWRTKSQDIEDSAFELIEHLKIAQSELNHPQLPDEQVLTSFLERELEAYDPRWGGFGQAPKFPPAMTLLALLRIGRRYKDERAFQTVLGTLNGMARGGIRDHVGGGFHRYSVDETWRVPHFEKMLYDNALLALAYTEGYQITRSDEYQDVVETTLTYIIRDMQSEQGGYFSAEDADSEKAEGKFYLWTTDQLQEILDTHEFSRLKSYFPIEETGNFCTDHQVEQVEAAAGLDSVKSANILHQQQVKTLATRQDPEYARLMNKLLDARSKRIRPLRDDKIICAWNGLMIGAMAKAYKVFGQKKWLESSKKAADFILNSLWQQQSLKRCYRAGESRQPAYLEDYAGLIFGLIELYEASFDPRWILAALELQETQDRLFWDQEGSAYFDHDGQDPTILMRSKEFLDNAVPSGNSLSAWNLVRLSAISGQETYQTRASETLQYAHGLLQRFPGSFPMMMLPLDWISGKNWQVMIAPAQNELPDWPSLSPSFAPHVVFIQADERLINTRPLLNGHDKERSGLLYYACEKGSCQKPTDDLEVLQRILHDS